MDEVQHTPLYSERSRSALKSTMPSRITLLGLSCDKCSILPRRIVRRACEIASRKVNSTRTAAYTTVSTYQNNPESTLEDRSRWQQTPRAMTAPVLMRHHKPHNRYGVKEDSGLLDQVYIRVLGRDGDKMLTDEVKWLAVTHKSFDQGRRGYNDRLAFFGNHLKHPLRRTDSNSS